MPESFIDTVRPLYWLLFLSWAISLYWIRRPSWVLLGTLGSVAYLWGITTLPLGRVYALGVGSDRLNNLAMAIPAAAGNSFLQTHQVGQRNFEPFWSFFIAALSGWDLDRALAVYPYVSLLVLLAFSLSLYFGLRGSGDAWERAFAVYFAVLLSTSPGDGLGPYRSTWNVSFLLKPNHNLALVLVPPLLALIARVRTWRGRVVSGLLLHLIGWVFVLHWVYVSMGLVFYVGLSALADRSTRPKAARDVGAAIGINLAFVSPYLYTLFTTYPFTVRHDSLVLRSVSAHLLATTFDQGVVFLLALWGARVLYLRSEPIARLWLSLWLASFAVWLGYIGLSWAHIAREVDEIYFFIRITSGVLGGIGAWDLAVRGAKELKHSRRVAPAALLLLTFPLALPCWWDPRQNDAYFVGSVPPLPEPLTRVMAAVRRETAPGDAFIAGKRWGRYVAALGGRRLLIDRNLHSPPEYEARARLETALLRTGDSQAANELRRRWGVRNVLVDPDFLKEFGLDLELLTAHPILKRVFTAADDTGDAFILLRIEPGS